jgi:6-phosphogluconolactonase
MDNAGFRTVRCGERAEARVFADAGTMREAFAEAMMGAIGRRLESPGTFTLALTGGRTPEPLYRRLGREDCVARVDWTRVKVFFGDERTVGPDHPDSNYGMAWRSWLERGPVPQGQVFRMEGEAAGPAGDWAEAAARYEAALRREVEAGPAGMPALDLVLLGMGDDGHIASLFPGTRALEETRALAVANVVPQQKTTRLTLTFPILNAAREIWMLVTGEAKAGRVAQALGGRVGGDALPVGRVRPAAGRVVWWLDEGAARGL